MTNFILHTGYVDFIRGRMEEAKINAEDAQWFAMESRGVRARRCLNWITPELLNPRIINV